MRALIAGVAALALIVPATAGAGGVEEPHFGFKATGAFLGLEDSSPYRGFLDVDAEDVCVQTEVPDGASATGAELRRGLPGSSQLVLSWSFGASNPSAQNSKDGRLSGPVACASREDVSRKTIRKLRGKPSRFYVEIMTDDQPTGAYGGKVRRLPR